MTKQTAPVQGSNQNEQQAEEVAGSLIPRNELLRMIDDFFNHLYPIPSYAFLHEPSIRQQCVNGTIDQNLALSISAISRRSLSPGRLTTDASILWVAKVEMEIWSQLEKPSIIKLQSLLLVIHYHIQIGRFSRAYMLAGLAARASTALRLNYERPELSFIAQETRRRVLWALSSIDGSFSVGLPEYETISHAIIYQRLPSSEEAYREGNPAARIPGRRHLMEPESTEVCSLLAACIQLSKIAKDIMRLTRQLALSEQPLAQLSGLVQEIQNDLWRVQADVEFSFQYKIAATASVAEKKDSRWFPRYLQVSISWHQAHCDLYRMFLPKYPEAAPKVIMDTVEPGLKSHAVKACQEHVQNINQILQGLLDLTGHPALPSYIAVCAYHATRLTLFLPSSPELGVQMDMKSAIESANVTLTVLRRWYSNSAAVEKIILDMRHLVSLSRDEPGSIFRELCCPSPPLDRGRHRHSHLAIHSLVRQANFVDDGYD
jgi:hypothetical protein